MAAQGRPSQKTYWHLLGDRRVPSEYEVSTSKLLYYRERGFEVATPLAEWYRTHQSGSPFRCHDWGQFVDPRETTYTAYTELQSRKEAFAEELSEWIERTDHDRGLGASWLDALEDLFCPLRYPWHGFQMAACYIGSMAPEGRIAIALLFQAADEMRRIQHVARRMRQLQEVRPGFGARSRGLWQEAPRWQPLRQAVERLLTKYDWGQSFTLLNLVLKPAMDELMVAGLAAIARREDPPLSALLDSFSEDARWQRDWTEALVRTAIASDGSNRAVLKGWIDEWLPEVRCAVEEWAARLPPIAGESASLVQSVENRLQSFHRAALGDGT